MNNGFKIIGGLLVLFHSGFGFGITGVSQRQVPSWQFSRTLVRNLGSDNKRITQFHALHESVGLGEKDVKANANKTINPIKAAIAKAGVISFIASMCLALPVGLYPLLALYRLNIISKITKERCSLRVGQFCSRWGMRIFPFANIRVIRSKEEDGEEPVPTIWVCNHTSMLDVFLLMAVDKRMRGTNKRQIKIIYWKDLEKNPVTKLLFTMCGFISVQMEDNGNGNKNSYKTSSFRSLLKDTKQAFEDGFDIGILPEGQLNISPENGLQPVFPGAFTLAKMSRRPIRMLGIHGLNQLWHADETIGINVTGRKVSVRAYPPGEKFGNADQFVAAFENVIGHYGANGEDLPDWKGWLDGTAWEK